MNPAQFLQTKGENTMPVIRFTNAGEVTMIPLEDLLIEFLDLNSQEAKPLTTEKTVEVKKKTRATTAKKK